MVRGAAGVAVAVAGGLGVVWLGWHGGSTNPAAPVDRVAMIATVVMLAGLPWLGRWSGRLGPVGDSRAPRVVRAGGYAALCALLLVGVGLSRFAGARFDHFHAFNQAN